MHVKYQYLRWDSIWEMIKQNINIWSLLMRIASVTYCCCRIWFQLLKRYTREQHAAAWTLPDSIGWSAGRALLASFGRVALDHWGFISADVLQTKSHVRLCSILIAASDSWKRWCEVPANQMWTWDITRSLWFLLTWALTLMHFERLKSVWTVGRVDEVI